jgi:Domain of unknown function (DUF397)
MIKSTEGVGWRRSSFCTSGTCVEVAKVDDTYLVRDSEHPDVVLTFDAAEWLAFSKGFGAGEFDFPPQV